MPTLKVRVENTTQKCAELYRRQFSIPFSNYVDGDWYQCCFLPVAIEQKVTEIMQDKQILEAFYDPLRMRIVGEFYPSKNILSIAVGSGDNWGEDEFACNNLEQAEEVLVSRVTELIPFVAGSL